MSISNNPPDIILELTAEEACLLLANCEAGCGQGLNILQAIHDGRLTLPDDKLKVIVDLQEVLNSVRKKLKSSMGV